MAFILFNSIKTLNMNKHIITCLLGLMSVFFIHSCTWQNEEDLFPITNNPVDTVITYTTHIAPLFAAHCNSCHSNGTFPDISNFEAAVQHATRPGGVRARSVDNVGSPMPPTGLLPNAQRQLISRWIEQGMRQ
jgi:mono/diheme cytochrome c family protein